MAQNLPFSIANILRADFPDPSRVSKLPPIVQEQPQKENWESVFERRSQPLRGRPFRCDEVGPLDGNGACSTHVDALESCIEFLQPDFVGIEEEQQKNGTKKRTVQISSRDCKTQKLPKRRRTRFSRMQVKYLEDAFSCQHYLTRDERRVLANALGLKEVQIRNWFQNRRYRLRHQ
ncbi:unnamed protein product, partial [Pocillopora meandrina]